MRALAKIVIVATIIIIGFVTAYKLAYPTYTHRYRLTLAVGVDGKVHTGSSVIEVSWVGQPKFGGAPPFVPHVRGQAPLIDLGSHGVLAAALHPGTVEGRFANADLLAIRAFGLDQGFDAYWLIARQSGRRELPADDMPMLIWFANASDPSTARPTTVGHVSYLFGPTARLVDAYVEMTDDPVVVDIDRTLPWYAAMAAERRKGVIGQPGKFQLVYSMLVGAGT